MTATPNVLLSNRTGVTPCIGENRKHRAGGFAAFWVEQFDLVGKGELVKHGNEKDKKKS